MLDVDPKHSGDASLERLEHRLRPLAATVEAGRGRMLRGSAAETPALDTRRQLSEDDAGSLTTGKLNAVRAAFKAGVKPPAIARQFGISQSEVRKALAIEGQDRKSWR